MKIFRVARRYLSQVMPVVMIASLCISILSPSLAMADTNILSFNTQGVTQLNIGQTVTVCIKSWSGTSANPASAKGHVDYNPSLLQVVRTYQDQSSETDCTKYTTYDSISVSTGSGSVAFNAKSDSASAGFGNVFAIKFKAKSAGNAALSFSGESQVNGSSTTRNGVSIAIKDPNPKPSKSSKPKPTPSKTPTPTISVPPTAQIDTPEETPKPTPDPTGIVDSVVVSSNYTSGTITWKVHAKNPTSSMAYGLVYAQLDKTATVTQKSKGVFTASVSGLLPGKTYYFSITGGGKGGDTGSYTGTLPTRGYPVTIKANENGTPIKTGLVKVGAQSLPISNGTVTFGLAAGSYTGQITTDTAVLNISLTVNAVDIPTDGTVPTSQEFSFDLTSSPLEGAPGSGAGIFVFVGVLFGGLLLLVVGFFIFIAWRRRQFEAEGYTQSSSATGPTVVVEDGYDWRQDADMHMQNGTTTPQVPAPPAMGPSGPIHHNSVYLSEEEPLDMFDSANIHLESSSTTEQMDPPIEIPQSEPPQNPNQPHSTTP